LCSTVASLTIPPKISNDFTATIVVTESTAQKTESGSIVISSDSQTGRILSVTTELVGDTTLSATVVDLHLSQPGVNYVYSNALSQCTSNYELNAAFPSLFKWLTAATFGGKTTLSNRLVDSWSLNNGEMVLTLYVVGNVPVRLVQSVSRMNSTLTLDFSSFVSGVPNAAVFAVPAFCPKPDTSLFPAARTRMAHRVHTAMNGILGIHWKCDICKIAAEAIISAGCGAGSAICGPFAEVCDSMCEDGCMVAGCSDRACKKFHFC